MKKDRRICDIHRWDTLDTIVYVLLSFGLLLTLLSYSAGEPVGFLVITLVIMTGGIRIRVEIRRLREYFIKLENANRAERAGLAMPRLYEDVDDIREAVHEARFKKGPPS